jgi:hypothetical protein
MNFDYSEARVRSWASPVVFVIKNGTGIGFSPSKFMKWRPLGRRKRGRPKLTWAEGIKGLMGEKVLMEGDWNARSNWRKKIV